MSLAFCIPIIHPDHPIVQDYGHIESVLRLTVDSLLCQTADDVYVVIAAHRIPTWAPKYDDRVRFVTVPEHAAVTPERFDHVRNADLGMKRSLAALYAISEWAPDHLLYMDGDDFIDIDVARRLKAGEFGPGGADGYIIAKGYHALMQRNDSGFDIMGAMAVNNFDATCGSCRIFGKDALLRLIAKVDQNLPTLGLELFEKYGTETDVSPLLDLMETTAESYGSELENPLRLLGHHILLEDYLDFVRLEEPLAAKGCGHSDHVGWRRGGVHWHLGTGSAALPNFCDRFGLSGLKNLRSIPRPWVIYSGIAKSQMQRAKNKVLRLIGVTQPKT